MSKGYTNTVDTVKYPSADTAISIDTSFAGVGSTPPKIGSGGAPIIRS